MWFKFDVASGRLAPNSPIESLSHQVVKPVEVQNFKPAEMVFDRPVKMFSSVLGVRKNATAAAVPSRPPPGTVLPGGLVMGEFGPYDPKIRKLQEFFTKDDGKLVWLKKPSDRITMGIVSVMAAVTLGCVCLNAFYLIFPAKFPKK